MIDVTKGGRQEDIKAHEEIKKDEKKMMKINNIQKVKLKFI